MATGTVDVVIRIYHVANKEMTREILIGNKFSLAHLHFHDRSTAIGFSYDKQINFYRIDSQKPIFSLKCLNSIIVYHLVEMTANIQVLIAQTLTNF